MKKKNALLFKILSILIFIFSLLLIINSYSLAISTSESKLILNTEFELWQLQYSLIAYFISYLVSGIILCIASIVTFIHDINFKEE